MSGMKQEPPLGVLEESWSAVVGEYAMAGGWSPSGEFLVVGDAAGGVYGFDGDTGTNAWTRLDIHEGGVLAVSFHPHEPLFATCGPDGRVLIWSAADGQVEQAIDVGNSWVEHLAWSPDGQRLAASCSRHVFVFDQSGSELWQSDQHPSTVSSIAWSNATQVATACYGRVGFFDALHGELVQTLEWKGSLVSMVLSPDGDVVACGSQDNSVHFWRRSTGQDSMMSGYPGKPTALAFDDTGTCLATNGGEKAVTVWSFRGRGPEGTRPGVLKVHMQPVTSLTFAHGTMRLASGAKDGAVVVWSVQDDGNGDPDGLGLVSDTVAQLYWRPDNRALAALDACGGVTVWNVED